MGSDEESYGDFNDDDDLEGSLNQASQTLPTARREGGRPTKKRRIIAESDDSMDDFISDDNTTSSRRNAMVSKSKEFDSEDELSEPSSCAKQRRRDSRASTECSYDNESHQVEKEKAEKKKKQKQFIHVDNVPDIPATQVNYATQLPANMEDPDSSPSQIRGAKWIFKKPEMPKPPAARGLVSNAQTFRKGASSSSPASRLGRTSTVNIRKTISPGQRLAAFTDVVAPALQHETQRNAAAGMIQQKISNLGGPSQIDLAHELEGLDYEDFASSPDMAPAIGSHLPTVMSIDDEDDDGVPSDLDDLEPRATQTRQRLVAPQTGLRQTTLFGGQASSGEPRPSQARKVHNYRVDLPPEEPTHHELDQEALKTWVYPTNLGAIRDYQFTIVSNALFNNTLVALPTGLGKTFIAATVMLNFFRWTKKAQIVFMAPTKPLVAQQVDACFNIVGIPRSATTMLNGEVPAVLRREEWLEKRVFFMTPQTLENDLRNGLADPKNICLLVVDEAHRATGNYAYTKVISIIKNFNKTFRVLALTATPGSNVEAVQEVIDNLGISKVEIRTEDSIDIRPFVHNRNIDQIELEPSDEMAMIQGLICKTVQPLVNKLCEQRAYQNRDPMALNQFQLLKAQRDWSKSDAGRKAPQAVKGMVQALYQVLITMAHSMKLLNFHGMSPFFVKVKEFRTSVEETGSKSKTKLQITNSPDFQKMMDYLKLWINNPDFVGHPKLTYLCDTLLNHFMDAGDGRSGPNDPPSATRSIVFCEYRESAEEICRVLNRHKPMIRASVFVGQADTKTSTGMTQEKQQKTINDFKSGIHNVIVATSIGEEGLDIGQVDLIVCYDASSSPIRMLQRMGRTGRKRAGQIVLLLMKGKEVQNFAKSKDNYEKIQKMICDGSRFNFRDDLSHRIVPRTIKPAVDKRDVAIPVENTQNNSMPEPKKSRARGKKLPPKKFHVPDGVEMGFVTGSDFFGSKKSKKLPALKAISELDEEERMPVPPIETVLLSQQDELELERRYQNVQGDGKQEVCYPEFTLHPEAQRQLGVTRKVRHGEATKRLVKMLRSMHDHERSIKQTELWRQVHDGGAAKKAPPESFITSSPLTKKIMSPPVEELESDGLEVLPPAKSARQPRKKAAPRKKKSRARATLSDGESVDNSADNMISNDEDDDGSDLMDFIADDKVITYDSNASQSPTSSIKTTLDASTSFNKDQQLRPFFEMTQFTQESMNDDDDEMPDISVLVGNGKAETIRKPLQETGVNDHVLVGKAQGARGSKRRIIAEDSDDE